MAKLVGKWQLDRLSKDFLAVLAALLMATNGSFQSRALADPPGAGDEPIEEVTAYGEKSILVLKIQVWEAEDQVFDTFNALNSDNEFDIRCERGTNAGSHIKKRICKPRYLDDLYADQARSMSQGLPTGGLGLQIRKKEKLLMQEMEKVLQEDEAFRQALQEYTDAKEALDEAIERRCEGRTLFCFN